MTSFESVNNYSIARRDVTEPEPLPLPDLNQPVNNYTMARGVPAEPEPEPEPEREILPVLLDLNKPPPPNSSIDENEVLGFGDEGACGASGVREIAKAEVEERSSSLWANKRKSFFKWLGASAKIFKKKKKDDSNA